MVEFASPWDELLFEYGPPSMFTLDPAGRLRVDPERTRECFLLVGAPVGREVGHFVLTDRVTGLRLYTLVSHPVLATCQPRADVVRYADAASAMEAATRPPPSRAPAS